MKTLLGTQLDPAEQRRALARYVHRFTCDHVPQWARNYGDAIRPKYLKVQFASDADWLANTRFHVTKDGKLSRRHSHCVSSPTWPDNPELRRTVAA
jgi:hypothetical protein